MERLTGRNGQGKATIIFKGKMQDKSEEELYLGIDKIVDRLAELEDKLESGELREVNNKPLLLDELKGLQKGDWIWFVDKEAECNTGYYKIKSINISHILLQQGLTQLLFPYALYGMGWIAYKTKEAAEARLKELRGEE